MRQRTTLHDWYERQAAWDRLKAENRLPIPPGLPPVRPLNEFIKGPPTVNHDLAAERCGLGIEICMEGCKNFGIAK